MRADVLVVGAGPVGLTFAIEVARYKVAVRIIDKSSERTDKSMLSGAVPLSFLKRAGVNAGLIEAGYKVDSFKVLADKKPIARFTFEGLKAKTQYPSGLMIPQSSTERILEDFVSAALAAVEPRRQFSVAPPLALAAAAPRARTAQPLPTPGSRPATITPAKEGHR